MPTTSHVLLLIGILLASTLLAVTVLSALGAGGHERQIYANTMWLKSSDFDHVADLVRDQRTLTDQELREVATTQLRNVLADVPPAQPATASGLRQTLFVVIPIAAMLISIIVLFASCYPVAVFLWGDEDKRWAAALWRRKAMWGIIGTILIGGLLANAFFQGVGGLFPGN
jgi:hypothetical protein